MGGPDPPRHSLHSQSPRLGRWNGMTDTRYPLYERLPEIYRQSDAEQNPPFLLREYLRAYEEVFGALHDDISTLYDDFFIETCDPWVVPYIGELVAATALRGDSRTLRADAANTVGYRRRKGTLGAIEQ